MEEGFQTVADEVLREMREAQMGRPQSRSRVSWRLLWRVTRWLSQQLQGEVGVEGEGEGGMKQGLLIHKQVQGGMSSRPRRQQQQRWRMWRWRNSASSWGDSKPEMGALKVRL